MPVSPEYVTNILELERPDSIMLSFGGQTALNCGVALEKNGILEKYGIKVLGTQIQGIQSTEDRQLFKDSMTECELPVLESSSANSIEESQHIAKRIGYPVIIRVAYTLGGRGGGVAYNDYELQEVVQRGLALSIVRQVLIEKYVGSWKQIEYEVMRDHHGNSVIVCNMENVLAMKVHTGDNIVVAPSQTLNNYEYHMLRSSALKATRKCGIIGECNIQFGLDPSSENYCVIEVNARLSRSSALASKATGYPLAYMAAKISLGYSLPELVNTVTRATTACFEPSLDYVVLKMPRWDFKKFELAKKRLGSAMKSVGEVMAIGRNFEEVLQKAIRMCDNGKHGLVSNSKNDNDEQGRKNISSTSVADNHRSGTNHLAQQRMLLPASLLKKRMVPDRASDLNSLETESNPHRPDLDFQRDNPLADPTSTSIVEAGPNECNNGNSNSTTNLGNDEIESIEQSLLHPTDEILFDVVRALKVGMSVERVNSLSSIDPWFLNKIQTVIQTEINLKTSILDRSILMEAKKMGFSDVQIANCTNINEIEVRALRKKLMVQPVTKQIDTLACRMASKNQLSLSHLRWGI